MTPQQTAEQTTEKAAEHSILTQRTGRFYAMGSKSDSAAVWVVLHGYGQLAEPFIQDFSSVASDTRLIVAPEALSRFYLRAGQGSIGANWMTSEDRENEINDYVTYLDTVTKSVVKHSSQSVYVLGFSQGSATACRWFERSELDLKGILVWGGGIPPDLDTASFCKRLNDEPLRFVVGDSDPFMPQNRFEAEVKSLEEAQVSVATRTFSGKHGIDPDVLLEELLLMEASD